MLLVLGFKMVVSQWPIKFLEEATKEKPGEISRAGTCN